MKVGIAMDNNSGDLKTDGLVPSLFKGWMKIPFEQSIKNAPGIKSKLKQSEIKTVGKMPVVDQGESFIAGYTDDENNLYKAELPLIVFGDHTRRIKYVDFPFAVGADGTKIIIPENYFLTRFFYQYLNALNWQHEGYGRNYKFLKQIIVPLPPLNEQKRIVAKLDAIMPRIEAVKARLDKVPGILQRFRQSVLTAAVTGKLTEQWREEHPEVESAEVLLERIRKKREERYKKECEEAKKKGKRIPKNNLPRFTSEISEVDCLWINIEIQQIFDVETGATPLKSNNAYYEAGTIPWVKSGDVNNCDIFECEEMITEKALKETNVKYYPVNSLLIAMYGEGKTRGQIGKLKFEATSNQACAALINPSLDEAIINYAYLFGRSQYEHLRMQAAGGNQPNLNLAKIKEWIIPLPPLEEQKEIVRQVDKLFALADKVESHYQKAKARVDKLSQSVLAKAFRGELVPQDPNDEPAEKLLERILEEKARLSQGTQRTRRKKK